MTFGVDSVAASILQIGAPKALILLTFGADPDSKTVSLACCTLFALVRAPFGIFLLLVIHALDSI